MKKGLTSNGLKIIAIITMLIDHIGYYMYPYLQTETYYLFRTIGRISMPIFAYLIVQGFFHTKNLKKYIYRIFGLAVITQICLAILSYININYFPGYHTRIYSYLNILFSYTLSLIVLSILDRKKIIERYNELINLGIKILLIIIILATYLKFDIDYGMRIPFIMAALYGIEKIFNKTDYTKNLLYLCLIMITFFLYLTSVENSIICKYSMLLSLLFIAFYNGQKGKISKSVQYLFYVFFPIHHVLLYLISMILY